MSRQRGSRLAKEQDSSGHWVHVRRAYPGAAQAVPKETHLETLALHVQPPMNRLQHHAPAATQDSKDVGAGAQTGAGDLQSHSDNPPRVGFLSFTNRFTAQAVEDASSELVLPAGMDMYLVAVDPNNPCAKHVDNVLGTWVVWVNCNKVHIHANRETTARGSSTFNMGELIDATEQAVPKETYLKTLTLHVQPLMGCVGCRQHDCQ
ncbi:hypothetical protein ABBQ38_015437 [Trebouxia sp. C0009 RCD-2024]